MKLLQRAWKQNQVFCSPVSSYNACSDEFIHVWYSRPHLIQHLLSTITMRMWFKLWSTLNIPDFPDAFSPWRTSRPLFIQVEKTMHFKTKLFVLNIEVRNSFSIFAVPCLISKLKANNTFHTKNPIYNIPPRVQVICSMWPNLFSYGTWRNCWAPSIRATAGNASQYVHVLGSEDRSYFRMLGKSRIFLDEPIARGNSFRMRRQCKTCAYKLRNRSK